MNKITESDIFIENIRQLWRRRRFIILNTIILVILSIAVSLILPKWYASKATIIASGGGTSNFLSMLSGIPMGEFGLSALNEDISSYIAILESREVKEKIVKKFDLMNRYNAKDIEMAMESLSENVELRVSEEGSLVITVLDKDPITARDIAEELITQLDMVNRRLSSEKGKFNREFLELRLNENMNDLKNAEDSLKAYQQQYGIVDVPSQVSSAIETYAQLYAKKVDVEIQYKTAIAIYSSDNPKIKQLEYTLVEIDKLIDEMNKKGDESGVLIAFNNMPELGLEYARLFREVEMQSKILELLVPQYEQAKMEESKNIPTLQVIDRPYIALNKAKPQRSLIVIATSFMAFILSVIFVLIEYRSRDFRSLLKNS